MSKASEEALASLHSLLANALTGIIKDGVTVLDKQGNEVVLTCPAAYIKEAREFLKDNNTSALPAANKPLQNLAAVLPFPSPEDGPDIAVG